VAPLVAAPPFDAVILAGGGSRRMGGVDKMTLDVGGHQLLDRVLLSVRLASRVVVAGPSRELQVGHPELCWVTEDPPGGGPVAGLAAGLELLAQSDHAADVVAVLAGDLPFVDEDIVGRLQAALSADSQVVGAVLVDATGRDQPLISVWRAEPLRSAMPAEPAGSPVWRVLAPLSVTRVGCGQPMLDCDTPYELDLARSLVARGSG
jgi:molybdopterin-guanine dinucleotide biosynthesis protein A